MPEPEGATFAALERWLAAHHDRERTPTAFGLETMQALLARLDHPQRAFAVVQVAGTKGKGTTSAAIASILDASGLRVGLYTSPHLVDLRERIRLGAAPAPDAAWLDAWERLRGALDEALQPSWFELVTALACLVFHAQQVDVAVLEVGLGGRLDATSACAPALSVVTRIGIDHTAWLGETLAEIAAEKAAIVRAGVPAVVGPGDPEACAVVEARAADVGAPCWRLGHELTWTADGALQVGSPVGRWSARAPLSPGPARANLALAAAASAWLAQRRGWRLTPGHVRRGLERLRWRGRQEWVEGPPPLLVDGAHEAGSAQALREVYRARHGDRPHVWLCAIAVDKPIDAVLDALAPGCAEAWCCTGGHPRALAPVDLAARFERRGVPARLAPDDPAQALEAARARAQALDAPLVVAGSLYLAGAVLAALGEDVSRAWD